MDVFIEDPRISEISSIPRNISFSFFSLFEINSISVTEIFCPVFFDIKGKTIDSGLCDSRLGPSSKYEICNSCKGSYSVCPGHFGHIELAIPVFNPLLKNIFISILNAKCWYCSYFKLENWKVKLFHIKIIILDLGLSFKSFRMDQIEFLYFNLNSGFNFRYIVKIYSLLDKILKNKWLKKNTISSSGLKPKNKGKIWNKTLENFLDKSNQLIYCQKCRKNRINIKDKELNVKIRIVKKKLVKYLYYNDCISFDYSKKKISKLCMEKNITLSNLDKQETPVRSFQIKKHLCDLWNFENDFCELIWGCLSISKKFKKTKGHEIFYLSKILVPPTRFRPVYFSKLYKNNESMNSNPQNFYFLKILKINQQIILSIGLDKYNFKKLSCDKQFNELEVIICSLFDNSVSLSKKNVKYPAGIRQQLEQKFGLFRMHLMGKRVCFSARSVVVSDPFLRSNEVGFPRILANKVMISVILNQFNKDQLCGFLKKCNSKLISNKTGIKRIETIFGDKINILGKKFKMKFLQLIQLTKKYYEYYLSKRLSNYGITRVTKNIDSGDLILLNRQPSLHRASIMAHNVFMKKKTKCFSINYVNCNPYNADFDGDEMNAHIIQNYMSKAEALILSMANNHTKIPTQATPIRSLIQDHIVSAVLLTKKDNFFNQNSFFHIISYVFGENIIPLVFFCPTIIKPQHLWTGKQIISIILKMALGRFANIFLESKNKISKVIYGQDENVILFRNGELLRGILDGTQLGKNKYGVIHAFHEKYGNKLTDKILSTLSIFLTIYQRNHGHTTGLDDLISFKKIENIRTKTFLKEISLRKMLLRKIISKRGFFFENNSNKKKLSFICNLMGFLFNQKNIYENYLTYIKNLLIGASANLVENSIPGSLEKNFQWNGFLNMTLTGSKGSSVNIFQICTSLGFTELEGKNIPRGYGGKTLPIFFPYDISSKSNGFIYQRFLTGLTSSDFFFHCMAGREGLLDTAVKTSQSGYIQRNLVKHLENSKINYDLTVRKNNRDILQMVYSENGLSATSFEFQINLPWYCQNILIMKKALRNYTSKYCFKILEKHLFVLPNKLLNTIQKTTDNFNLRRKLGFPIFNNFFIEEKLFNLYQKNLSEPGEPIGIIASQSIGEPCTQMTLNTFHYAGKIISSGNQGIPRLREILLVASTFPKNPTMSVYFQKNLKIENFLLIEKRIKKIFISDLTNVITFHIEKTTITTLIIQIRLCPRNCYKHQFSLNLSYILDQLKRFLDNSALKKTPSLKICTNEEKKVGKTDKINFYLDRYNEKKKKNNYRKIFKYSNLSFNLSFLLNQMFYYCIRKISRINSSFIDFKNKTIHLEGVNFFALWLNQDLLDLNKIYSNDIYALLVTYGIEASRKALFSELETIFQLHAISVNQHHIGLISDYMTRMGNYISFSRMGMDEEKGFQKITYETALKFITESAFSKIKEEIDSASSSICTGKICNIGTGYFDIIHFKN